MTVFKTILLSIFWLSLTTNTWAAGLQNIESVKDENQVLSSLHDYLFQLEESIKETNQSLLETERKLETCLKDQSLILASANGSIYVVEKLNKLEDSVKQLEEDNFTKRDIVIQRRIDGSENFYRPWNDYKHGFGNSSGEFFIGLDVINKLTNSRPYALLVVMEDFDNDRRYAKYDQFIIGNEAEKYILKQLGRYSGSAGDALSYSLGQKFTTIDEDNDLSNNNCAVQYTGAWWYKSCHESNLNGRYLNGTTKVFAQGVDWYQFRGHYYSLKYVEMILRPN